MKAIMELDQSFNQRVLQGEVVSRGTLTPGLSRCDPSLQRINLAAEKSRMRELGGSAFPPGARTPKEGPKARKLRSELRKWKES